MRTRKEKRNHVVLLHFSPRTQCSPTNLNDLIGRVSASMMNIVIQQRKIPVCYSSIYKCVIKVGLEKLMDKFQCQPGKTKTQNEDKETFLSFSVVFGTIFLSQIFFVLETILIVLLSVVQMKNFVTIVTNFLEIFVIN